MSIRQTTYFSVGDFVQTKSKSPIYGFVTKVENVFGEQAALYAQIWHEDKQKVIDYHKENHAGIGLWNYAKRCKLVQCKNARSLV